MLQKMRPYFAPWSRFNHPWLLNFWITECSHFNVLYEMQNVELIPPYFDCILCINWSEINMNMNGIDNSLIIPRLKHSRPNAFSDWEWERHPCVFGVNKTIIIWNLRDVNYFAWTKQLSDGCLTHFTYACSNIANIWWETNFNIIHWALHLPEEVKCTNINIALVWKHSISMSLKPLC